MRYCERFTGFWGSQNEYAHIEEFLFLQFSALMAAFLIFSASHDI